MRTLFSDLLAHSFPLVMDEDQDKGGGKSKDDDKDKDGDTSRKAGGSDKDKDGDDGFKAITSQDELDRILTKRLKSLRNTLKEEVLEDAKRDAAAEEAKKNGNFEELYNAEVKRAEGLQAKLDEQEKLEETRAFEDLKRKVAKDVGIPEDAIKRMTGSTEKELRDDAKDLLKILVPDKDADDIDAGKTREKSKMSDEEMKKLSDPATWGLPS